ncbi:MAG: hypothetical protein A3F12_01435 [Gammaproteobacteria bacterium RIFCSPHIGHO2_12_FULL_38_14]|nr:MAG: hypothetical protein A3F12_01435 [Gammaproteobacteria bacterium RIFCSPHIGHO2_12_FULL_38_14]
MQKIKWAAPFLILLMLLSLLWHELFSAEPGQVPSALIGETVPPFNLPSIFQSGKNFSNKDLPHQVSLLNVWATWCYACSLEAPMLLKIKNQYHIPIYSILYKDDKNEAITWLQKYGNPFVITGDDKNGDTAIDLGVYGTPETFVINTQGKIIYRHIGTITQQTWDDTLYPLIKKLSA